MYHRAISISAIVLLLASLLSTLSPSRFAKAQGSTRYFPETKHSIQGLFLTYWDQHGGLAQQGYPLTEEFREISPINGKVYTVQYFERAIFEHHPENGGTPYEVLLSQLGVYERNSRYPNGVPTETPNSINPMTFPETGKVIGGTFRTYWESHGGLAQQGYPITNEILETNKQNGKPYIVQYFERAVFEFHPENRGTPYDVLLSQLGNYQYQRRYLANEWIQVSRDGKGFIKAASGQKFVPWGLNYDHDWPGRLLEDYWEPEWSRVVGDFHEMKALGANVVRIHLQFGKFIEGPAQSNERALDRLGRLVALAEELGIYIDLTGLGSYRKADVPAWYNALSENDRWNAQAFFWESVASRIAGSPAIFCYDLMNEPLVPTGRRDPGGWLLEPPLAGFYYNQFISLDQGGRPRSEIARKWIQHMTGAIRKHDLKHMITVGLHPNAGTGFEPEQVASELDFLSTHIYPASSKVPDALATAKRFSVGKPLLIEETFPLLCSAQELESFIVASKPWASGWLGFYWGKTQDELRPPPDFIDAIMLDWLELFQKLKPSMK
jgi:hypothetical protein